LTGQPAVDQTAMRHAAWFDGFARRAKIAG
jgi:hypothetical protein